MSDIAWVRIGILAAGLLLVAAIYFFGKPARPTQGKRRSSAERDGRREPVGTPGSAGADDLAPPAQGDEDLAAGHQAELAFAEPAAAPELGKRVAEDFDKIVSLYVAARAGQVLRGEDIVVAAEKTGMVFGHMGIFHRLVEGKPEAGPVFSMASILKPGNFDMATIGQMETPAVAFFLTLPAPLPALDAWEKMEPTVQRMAELLDAIVLDDSRNALGRQRIAHIRDELRAYDRQHEAPPLTKPPRW